MNKNWQEKEREEGNKGGRKIRGMQKIRFMCHSTSHRGEGNWIEADFTFFGLMSIYWNDSSKKPSKEERYAQMEEHGSMSAHMWQFARKLTGIIGSFMNSTTINHIARRERSSYSKQ